MEERRSDQMYDVNVFNTVTLHRKTANRRKSTERRYSLNDLL